MSEHTIVERLRVARQGGYTLRFHTSRRLAPETVGQHVYGGLAILHTLTGGAVSKELLWAWVFHDAPEQEYGDVPAPSKRDLGKDFGKAWNAREAAYNAEWGMDYPLTSKEHALLKLADCMDGVYSCLEEMRLGNASMVVPFRNYIVYTGTLLNEGKDIIYAPSVWRAGNEMLEGAIEEWNFLTGGKDAVSK